MEVNIARIQCPWKPSTMVRLCCIYWKYTGDQGWCNGGIWSRFPAMWSVFEVALEDPSELVEFVSSVLYSPPKGFRPVLTFALKTSISCFQMIWSIINYSVGYENPESLVKWLLLLLSELSQNLFSYLYLRTLFSIAIITSPYFVLLFGHVAWHIVHAVVAFCLHSVV